MKKRLIAISLLFSFMLVVMHNIIPHHHHELQDFFALSHDHHQHDSEPSDSKDDHDHNIPFPNHQHVSAAHYFDLIQKNSNLSYSLFFVVEIHSGKDVHSIFKPDPPGIFNYAETSITILSPILLSPNSLRGSPSFA